MSLLHSHVHQYFGDLTFVLTESCSQSLDIRLANRELDLNRLGMACDIIH